MKTRIELSSRKNALVLAEEFVRLIGKSLRLSGRDLWLDTDDAAELATVAQHAATYWQGRGKKALAREADEIREVAALVVRQERARLSWSK